VAGWVEQNNSPVGCGSALSHCDLSLFLQLVLLDSYPRGMLG